MNFRSVVVLFSSSLSIARPFQKTQREINIFQKACNAEALHGVQTQG